MIALDSSVLVRLLVQDDPVQADLAGRLIESDHERGERCFVLSPRDTRTETRSRHDFTLDKALRDEEDFTLLA